MVKRSSLCDVFTDVTQFTSHTGHVTSHLVVVEMTQDTLRTELICVVYDLYTVVLLDCRKSET